MTYLTKPLDSSYIKKNFSCGISLLDDYLHKQAKQDMKRKLTVCFVLADENHEIKGYYTLSNYTIPLDEIPENLKTKMPKSYTNLPVTLLGRLATDERFKGLGYGKLLLLDALKRSYDVSCKSIGSMAIVADPIDTAAISFYTKYGFIQLPESGKMFVAMKTIEQLFSSK
jgi:GNAT superfamily N-acetyltransferase